MNGRTTPDVGRIDMLQRLLLWTAMLAAIGVAVLFVMITAFALPLFVSGSDGGPFSWTWDPGAGLFGILPMIVGSVAVSVTALCIGWPVAFGVCCWLLCPDGVPSAGRDAPRRLVGLLVRMMTAVPTVVYGFAALFLLTPLVRSGFGGTGLGWLTTSSMLALLILPTVVLVLRAGLAPRLDAVTLAGLATGLTRLDLLRHVVLPNARGTLFASLILGFGRAVGDSMLPLMLAGNAPDVPKGLLSGVRTLTSHMGLVTANEVGGAAYDSLFMAGLLLLLVNAAVSLGLRRLGRGGGPCAF